MDCKMHLILHSIKTKNTTDDSMTNSIFTLSDLDMLLSSYIIMLYKQK